jgi:hypothetical protein
MTPRNTGLANGFWTSLFIGMLLVASMVAAGCGGRDLHKVSGTVRFPDGSPVPLGRVVVAYGDGGGSWGRIQQDGRFTIGTFTEKDGMKAGTYRVAIKDAEISDLAKGTVQQLVHRRFLSPETSGLSFSVPDQMSWDIVVDKP